MNFTYCAVLIVLSAVSLCTALGPYPSTSPHTLNPRLKSSKNKYTPTNSWFENWLLNKGESTIQTYPYQIQAKKDGLCISYSGHMVNQPRFVLEGFLRNVILSTAEDMQSPLIDQSTVDADFYDLSAKVNYGSNFNVLLVRGSASVIANYNDVTPVISTIHAITSSSSGSTRQLTLQFNNGQKWLVQSQSPINWQKSGSKVTGSRYTGWIKVSIVTSSATEAALNNFLDAAPITNGHLSYKVDRAQKQVVVDYQYDQDGLFYLLPHIYKTGQTGANVISSASVVGIKGTYLLASGRTYQIKVPIYENSNRNAAIDTPSKKANLKAALVEDSNNVRFNAKDPYFGGKELARAARLIEIADLLGETQIMNKIKNQLTSELDNFWFGISNNKPALVFEPTWGGIVSRASVGNAHADFGQYYYNDHHFHYGYHIYAAAVLAKYYPDYYESRKQYYRAIVADYAGTCEYEELPCQARAKDPFLLHSYAAGIFEFADSRNQESTSESINGYYAVRELGKNTNDQSMEDLGNFLLSTEIMSSKMYWQIKDNEIYKEPFSNSGVVGILWETKVDYATFFGANAEYIYGIQMLPFTDITQSYMDPVWLRHSKAVWSAAINSATDSWKCFLLLADAIVDPSQPGLSDKIHRLKSFDNGNSKTNTLYFYYMLSGSTDSTLPPNVSTIEPLTTPGPTQPTTKPTTKAPVTADPNSDDAGVPHPSCSSVHLGCVASNGKLMGCYNPSTATCFPGGSICAKGYVACYDPKDPQPHAACFLPAIYQ